MPLRLLAVTAVLAAAGASGAVAASAQVADPAAVTITARGAGGVTLGKRHAVLREQDRVGRLRPGCELAGPGTHGARLRRPLRGVVDYRRSSPPRVRSLTVTGGSASAKGVRIGSTLADVRAAFPHARVDRGPEETFGWALVSVPRRDGGRMAFAVDADSGRVSAIGVPVIATCE
jgi:hypothetical protein